MTELSYANYLLIRDNLDIQNLPIHLWEKQAAYYNKARSWFDGSALDEISGKTSKGEIVRRFPLRLGVRNMMRKHVSFIFGEVEDLPTALAKTIVSPREPFVLPEPKEDTEKAAKPTEEDKLAFQCQSVINEIWSASGGRGLQQEAAYLQQYYGGVAFQLKYHPTRTELTIPILIHLIEPEHFYPVWSSSKKDDLLEAYVVKRIPKAVAIQEYGVDNGLIESVYIEHWTKENYSIYIGNEPVKINGETYKDRKNPFKIVPFVYIPHLREGDYYGVGHIEDLEGIMKEINARKSDLGLAVKNNIARTRYLSNVITDPTERNLPGGKTAIDLGQTGPGGLPPEVDVEDPPNFPPGFLEFMNMLDKDMIREAHLNETAYGEDEGSQRSALTLAFRMWPSTSHARQERTFWMEGIARIFYIAIVMTRAIQDMKIKMPFPQIPEDFNKRVVAYPDWAPQIPRDRESLLNEVVLRSQANLLSPELALEKFGDVRNIPEELKRIRDYMLFVASLNATPASGEEDGAPQDLNEPVATPGELSA